MALVNNGVDERKRIIGTRAPTPYLFNLPIEFIERFRNQIVQVIDLLNRGTPELIRKAVWSCYQEGPIQFENYTLYDIGAYPGKPISAKITWRVTNPVAEPKDEEEHKQKEELMKKMEMIKRKAEAKKRKV